MTSTTLQLSENGLRVGLQDHGTGEPLVLIHGVGLQSAAWEPQIAQLRDSYRVLALDLPGHGRSDPLQDGAALPDFVAWCHSVIRALDIGPVNLAGHSMGALVAGGLAVSHPDAVRRVAVLNGVFKRNDAARAAVVDRAASIRAGEIDHQTPLDRWFGTAPANTTPRAQVAGWLEAVDRAGYGTAYAAFAKGDSVYAPDFAQITCPFLALTGDADQNSTPEMSRQMAALVRNGKHVVIKGHGHMVNLTAPDAVTGHLRDWLRQPALERTLP